MKPIMTNADSSEFQAGASAPSPRSRAKLLARMKGPGGYYNVGNVLCFATGIAVQLAAAPPSMDAAGALADYFAGDLSGIMLTLATIVFLTSGETYHRAWANGFPPDPALNRLGDFLSGVGCVALGIGLLTLGSPILAATSGILGAFGKFGSALHRPNPASAVNWPWIFRAVVVQSRAPAILAAVLELSRAAPAIAGGAPAAPLITAASLLVSYALWTKADLLLLKA